MLSGKASALPQALEEVRASGGTLAEGRWGWLNSLGRAGAQGPKVSNSLWLSGTSLKPKEVSSSIRQNSENLVVVNCRAQAAGIN